MGIWNRRKKEKDMGKQKEAPELSAPGWDAIDRACARVYPDQKEPCHHFASLIKWRLGGDGPLDGVSVYDGGKYWHFVTYGLSELYEKECEDPAVSGYGMEFTFKLKQEPYEDREAELKGICGILQSIAKLTFTKGELFLPYEYLYSGQKDGIDVNQKSNITGFITVPDREFGVMETPNGRVEFVEFIGVTDRELLAVRKGEIDVKGLYEELGSDVTDYHRESVR